jgi:uncharacterized protein (TIGR04255 family)
MAEGSLGQLPNAPLAYVLAAVRFDAQLALEKHISALQERLQADFPRFQPGYETVVQINAGGGAMPQTVSAQRFDFASADNRRGIILSRDTLAFHATAYRTYEDFGERLGVVLAHVGAELKHLFVRRIGLRFVDIIVPEEGETPDDYVVPGLRCLPALTVPSRARSGLAISEFQLEEGTLVIRYATAGGPIGLPPDLQPLVLAEPDVLRRITPATPMSALLDFDRFAPLEETFDASQLKDRFDRLHKDHSVAFRQLTTEHAREIWNRKGEP